MSDEQDEQTPASVIGVMVAAAAGEVRDADGNLVNQPEPEPQVDTEDEEK